MKKAWIFIRALVKVLPPAFWIALAIVLIVLLGEPIWQRLHSRSSLKKMRGELYSLQVVSGGTGKEYSYCNRPNRLALPSRYCSNSITIELPTSENDLRTRLVHAGYQEKDNTTTTSTYRQPSLFKKLGMCIGLAPYSSLDGNRATTLIIFTGPDCRRER